MKPLAFAGSTFDDSHAPAHTEPRGRVRGVVKQALWAASACSPMEYEKNPPPASIHRAQTAIEFVAYELPS